MRPPCSASGSACSGHRTSGLGVGVGDAVAVEVGGGVAVAVGGGVCVGVLVAVEVRLAVPVAVNVVVTVALRVAVVVAVGVRGGSSLPPQATSASARIAAPIERRRERTSR